MDPILLTALLIGQRYLQLLLSGSLDEAITEHNKDVQAFLAAREKANAGDTTAMDVLRANLVAQAKHEGAKLGAVNADEPE